MESSFLVIVGRGGSRFILKIVQGLEGGGQWVSLDHSLHALLRWVQRTHRVSEGNSVVLFIFRKPTAEELVM